MSTSLLLLLSVCQLESLAIDPGADLSGSSDVSEQTIDSTRFDQMVLRQLNNGLPAFFLKDVILGMMLLRKSDTGEPPKDFPIAVVRSTSISFSDNFSATNYERHQVIGLNNDGVKLLNSSNYPAAIKCFNKALELDSDYVLARNNLAIAYNNYGLSLRAMPKDALTQFHFAEYINPSNRTTHQNVEGIIRMLGLNPQSFEDRVKLGDQARSEGHFLGALVEYRSAFELQPTLAIKSKIIGVLPQLTSFEKLLNPYFIDKDNLQSTNVKPPLSGRANLSFPRLDFGPYMSVLQRSIERKWSPPEVSKSNEVTVLFSVNERGELTAIGVDHRSGIASADQAAIQAIENASPFPSPPTLPPSLLSSSASFKMTFTYKYLNGPVDFQNYPVDYSNYMSVLSRNVKQRWDKPPFDNVTKSTKTVVQFSIDKKGNLLSLKVSRSSGFREIDLSAERAIRDAAPFAELPPGADSKVDIQFTFDLNKYDSAAPPSAKSVAAPASSVSRQKFSATPYPFSQVTTYVEMLGERLEKNWHAQSAPVTVIFRVSDRGDVSGLQVYSSSGDTRLDEKALSLVRSCAPFPKPPAGALPLDVQYTFK